MQNLKFSGHYCTEVLIAAVSSVFPCKSGIPSEGGVLDTIQVNADNGIVLHMHFITM